MPDFRDILVWNTTCTGWIGVVSYPRYSLTGPLVASLTPTSVTYMTTATSSTTAAGPFIIDNPAYLHALRYPAVRNRPVPEGALIAEEAAYDQYHREHQERAAQAELRAAAVRDKYLTPAQRQQLTEHGYFDVEAASGLVYRIHSGTHGNIDELVREPDGTLRAVANLCCQPNGLPAPDAHLAQALWLAADEREFRRVANRLPYTPDRVPARGGRVNA